MPQNNITINEQAGALATNLAGALRSLQIAHARLTFLKSRMDNMQAGTDWTVVEAQFGLPSGKGQTLYNLVTGSLSHFSATAILNDASLRDLLGWAGLPG